MNQLKALHLIQWLLDNCKIINVKQVRKRYFSYTYSKNIIKYNDFVIRGSGLLIEHGELLNIGHKFGLISLHHGDNKRKQRWANWLLGSLQ